MQALGGPIRAQAEVGQGLPLPAGDGGGYLPGLYAAGGLQIDTGADAAAGTAVAHGHDPQSVVTVITSAATVAVQLQPPAGAAKDEVLCPVEVDVDDDDGCPASGKAHFALGCKGPVSGIGEHDGRPDGHQVDVTIVIEVEEGGARRGVRAVGGDVEGTISVIYQESCPQVGAGRPEQVHIAVAVHVRQHEIAGGADVGHQTRVRPVAEACIATQQQAISAACYGEDEVRPTVGIDIGAGGADDGAWPVGCQ